MRTLYKIFVEGTEKLQDVPLLLFRIILAIGFYSPAMMKVKNLEGVAEWFGSMGYPFPLVGAILTMSTEVLGILLLTLVVFGSGKYSLDYILDRRRKQMIA